MATAMRDLFLSEFDREMNITKEMLSRVPADKWDFKPHDKSTPLGKLAIHVATLPLIVEQIVNQDLLKFDGTYKQPTITNAQELVAELDKHVAAGRAALEGTDDERLMGNWKMMFGEHTVFDGPRIGGLRSIFMSHEIHHRAQLGVYLRLNDVAIPGAYGPSADEPMM